MRVDIEKRHIDSYKKIAREANKAVKRASSKVKKGKYEHVLSQKDISAETKKKKLAKHLHELIIIAFSLDVTHVVKKKAIDDFKANSELIRYLIHKIKAINNYLEESLLKEIGVIKSSSVVKALKSSNPAKNIEKNRKTLSKEYLHKIEHTVYELMQEIIFFDKEILKDYGKKEIRVIGAEKLGVNDLEKTLKVESELLDTLEAKVPPASKIKPRLFKKSAFNRWVPMVFALLSSFEAEYEKEKLIFLKIKKNNRLRKKIEDKINHVVNEKEKMLQIKEKRVLSMKSFKVSDDYRETFHEYVYAASL